MLFPTNRKDKIGKDLSYPIGAEALTAALGDLPQTARLSVTFQAPRQHSFRDGKPYSVLVAEYHRTAPNGFMPRDWAARPQSQPRWEIRVRAVPRSARHAIRTLLLEQGLPRCIRPWLVANDQYAGAYGHIELALFFDANAQCLLEAEHETLAPRRIAAAD